MKRDTFWIAHPRNTFFPITILLTAWSFPAGDLSGQTPPSAAAADTVPIREHPARGSAELPITLPGIVVNATRDLGAKRVEAALAHRSLAHEALGRDAAISSAVVQGASSLLYRDIPTIGTIYFRHGEPILFDTQESFTIESTFPSYHLRLTPVRSHAHRPASDLALSLTTEIEDGVLVALTPFRMEGGAGAARDGWRVGTSVAYRQVPGALVNLLGELGALGRGPRAHLIAEFGSEGGDLFAVEGLVSSLSNDYRALFGYAEYDEDQDQGYLFVRGRKVFGTNRLSLVTFHQQAETETRSVVYGEPRTEDRGMRHRGGTLALSRGESRTALRIYEMNHENAGVSRSFTGGQLDVEHTIRTLGSASLNLTGRLDGLRGDLHPSLYLIGTLPMGATTLEMGGGRLFDPLTPNRHGVNLLDLPGVPAALHQTTSEAFVAVERTLGNHTLRAQVQPRLIELPYLAHDLRVEGVTWRVSDRIDAGPYFASATLAIQQLQMVRDGNTGSFPATADRELKGVLGHRGFRFSTGLAAVLRQGVQFPTRGGEVLDIGDQFILNGSVSYEMRGLTFALSGVNLTHWLGHRNHIGIVWKDNQDQLVEMPSWPNLSLQYRFRS